ncbi:hypothetical protein PENSPDRAFT_73624 [Peniophora sp. CONT]|nr:hypothetical protein PENSPDRAFT_73624 [Peniophora sp. CONT]
MRVDGGEVPQTQRSHRSTLQNQHRLRRRLSQPCKLGQGYFRTRLRPSTRARPPQRAAQTLGTRQPVSPCGPVPSSERRHPTRKCLTRISPALDSLFALFPRREVVRREHMKVLTGGAERYRDRGVVIAVSMPRRSIELGQAVGTISRAATRSSRPRRRSSLAGRMRRRDRRFSVDRDPAAQYIVVYSACGANSARSSSGCKNRLEHRAVLELARSYVRTRWRN